MSKITSAQHDKVFYCELMNDLITIVVIFTVYFDIESNYFYWDSDD